MAFYDAVSQVWNEKKDLSKGAIGKEVWNAIALHIQPNSKTLEFGCGLSTLLFDYAGHRHTAIDNSRQYIDLVKSHSPSEDTTIIFSDLNSLGFYDTIPQGPFHCILIDGPAGEGNRNGVLDIIIRLVIKGTVIVVDDTNRAKDKDLSEAIQQLFNAERVIEGETSHDRKFDLIIV
ncbi:methyltransferase domain-containing protein [Gimesia fumaroli]|uniref:Methyltransferase domain protein n=1 Tax=Gimesia fumaroli TaxID=2527976 RepID=A0A518I953_9PLAN|nr:class I SAM-dependent methyltransferase [Gimesia fumaroli]QDV49522.1 hypothetical protein Enr17x_15410 [Gimesia fumaroli]